MGGQQSVGYPHPSSFYAMVILLAILSGVALGYVLERGDFCFHSTWRGVFQRPRDLNLMRAYWLALLVSIPLVQGMIWLGWIEPWVPPFAWPANLLGGVVFGVGMVAASSCITGLFYKLGQGMLGTVVGLAAWAVGDVVTYSGPLAFWRDALNAAPLTVNGESATLLNVLGPLGGLGGVVVVGLGVATAVYLVRSWRSGTSGHGRTRTNAEEQGQQVRRRVHFVEPAGIEDRRWQWPALGLATGVVVSVAWLLAQTAGSDYPYGTSRVPTGVFEALSGQMGGGSVWIPVALASLVPGALLAAWLSGTLWVRGETAGRYGGLAGGGFLMGVGAAIAGGCNLGHSLVGVPLLSLGSITTTLAMGLGVFLAGRVLSWRTAQRSQSAHEIASSSD